MFLMVIDHESCEATKEVIEILKDNPDKTSWIIMVEKVLKMN